MATEIQFAGDHSVLPLWGRDADGYFDANLAKLRDVLSPELTGDLDAWARQWAEVDGGDREEDSAEPLIEQARQLASRVAHELGADYVVTVRWDARGREGVLPFRAGSATRPPTAQLSGRRV